MASEQRTKDNTFIINIMKPKLLLSLFLSFATLSVFGAKAMSTPFYFSQPDGTQLCYYIHGDEHFHWYTAADGTIIMPKEKAFYVAEISNSGMAKASTLLAHNRSMRSAAEAKISRRQLRTAFLNNAKEAQTRAALSTTIGDNNPAYFPHTGSPRALVVLAQFNDNTFTVENPKQTFTKIFNGNREIDTDIFSKSEQYKNYGSVQEYFRDMSFGRYTPVFTITDVVTLPHNMSYYGADSGSGTDNDKLSTMFGEALDLVKDQVDLSQFTTTEEGNAQTPMVFVIYAGYGQNSGGADTTIWAKSGTCNAMVNGVTFRRYCVTAELNFKKEDWENPINTAPQANGIGVICHEFSHAMGLPDFYPYYAEGRTVHNQEMEYWDLMDGGEYGKYGYRPTAYTAWEREVMGWMQAETLTKDTTITNLKSLDNGGKAFRIVNPDNNKECFMLEHYDGKQWNRNIPFTSTSSEPAHGLVVTHVNWQYNDVHMNQHVNEIAGKPGMAIVPADSLVISSYLSGEDGDEYTKYDYRRSHCGDSFPGTSNVTNLTDSLRLPNFTWYTRSDGYTNKALLNITENTAERIVGFNYIHDYNAYIATGIRNITINEENKNADNRIFSIDGRYAGTDVSRLPSGIYIKGKKKFVIR